MLDTSDPPFALDMAETKVLADAYGYALSCFELAPLDSNEKRDLAEVTVVAARVRRESHKGLDSCVDAHALAAEIVGLFSLLRQL